MLPVEGCQVELVDHVEDEPGEVAFGQPVAQVRGHQEGLVAVAAQEVVGHCSGGQNAYGSFQFGNHSGWPSASSDPSAAGTCGVASTAGSWRLSSSHLRAANSTPGTPQG